MEKQLYAMITPDPYEECTTLITPSSELEEVFNGFYGSDLDGLEFNIKFAYRTERWANKFPEI